MAKKKSLFSKFFAIMLKIVPFLFDTLFAIIIFIFNLILSVVNSLFDSVNSQIKEKQIAIQKPKTSATYKQFQILKTIDGSFEEFENHLFNSKSTIGLILGARGSGKSALGMRFLENISAKVNRSVCAMGFSKETVPSWIKIVDNIEDVPNNSFVLIDEGGITFSSRGSMSSANKLLSAFLLVARHKDLSILFISQNSANLEVNAIRQADYLLLRKSSLLQKDFERKKIKEIYAQAENFEQFTLNSNKLTYVYSTLFRGYVTNQLPSFWTEKTSKAFRETSFDKNRISYSFFHK